MKRATPIKKTGAGIIDAINQNNSLIFVVFCFLLGLFIGVLWFKFKNANGDFYSSQFKELYSQLSSGFASAFMFAATSLLPFAAAIFLSGTCMVGGVMVPVIMAIRGINLGLMMGYIYSSYRLIGIVFNLLMIIPSGIISTIALILSAREALGFSLSLARLAFPGRSMPEIDQDFKFYCLRQLFVLMFFAVSALVQTVMAVAFIAYFEF